MLIWLKPLLLMFYAPARGMGEARERVSLGAASLVALFALAGLFYYVQRPYFGGALPLLGAFAFVNLLINSAGILLFLALVFVPLAVWLGNLFERRASFGLAMRQDYPATAAAVSYALAAASLVSFVLLWLARHGGLEMAAQDFSRQMIAFWIEQGQPSPEVLAAMAGRETLFGSLMLMLFVLPWPFALWAVVAVREALRLSWPRAALVVLVSGALTVVVSPLVSILSTVLASPFLLVLLFLFVRGYFGEVARQQRARASFKQNLEAATLNPADASAHYNLGLLHLQRKELEEARLRFARAVKIDTEETDAHYQLGRLSREEGKLGEAIGHFQQVVARDERHAQYEVWREIGATYLAAGQHPDAHEALRRFLEDRQTDPEGLYLIGRTLAGLNRPRDAAAAMRACIEAVKTAPAYKYRADRRWLNEAQQFLKSQTT
ncbi:MAG: tetratricopeptide repeat protein [Pyrinomonadaceae bacterium]